MYILTNKENVITAVSSVYELDEKHRNIKLENYNVAYGPDEKINVYEVEVPEGVTEQKYCYTAEDGFYKNPNYVEYKSPEQQMQELSEQITDLQLALTELVEGGLE